LISELHSLSIFIISKTILKTATGSVNSNSNSNSKATQLIASPHNPNPNPNSEMWILNKRSNSVMLKQTKHIVSLLNAPIIWSKWKNPDEFDRHLERIEKEYVLLFEIMNIDKECSSEINLLYELNIYPSAELALIRKDIKILHEKQAQVDIVKI